MNAMHQITGHYFALTVAVVLLVRFRRSLWGYGGWLASRAKAPALFSALPRSTRVGALTAAAAIGALALLPGSMAAEIGHTASLKLRNWEMRPPAKTCLEKKYSVTVAGAAYYLPAAPVVTIRAGKNSYHFQSNKALRDICGRTPNAHAPIHAENLNLDFTIPMRGPYCQISQARWGRELCGQGSAAANDAYPTIANIYSPADYDGKHLMSGHSYSNFIETRDKAVAAKHPMEPEQSGIFERYANGYWIARTGAWVNDAGEPFTLHCQNTPVAGMLACTASYRLNSGPQITYHFKARAGQMEADARKIDRNLHQMLDELSEP